MMKSANYRVTLDNHRILGHQILSTESNIPMFCCGWGVISTDQDLGSASSFGETQEAVSVRSAWNVRFCWSWKLLAQWSGWEISSSCPKRGLFANQRGQALQHLLCPPQCVRNMLCPNVTERDPCEIDGVRWRLINPVMSFLCLGVLWHAIEVSFVHQKLIKNQSLQLWFVVKWLQIPCPCSRCIMMWLAIVVWTPHGQEKDALWASAMETGPWCLFSNNDIPMTYPCRHKPSPWDGQNTRIHRNIGT